MDQNIKNDNEIIEKNCLSDQFEKIQENYEYEGGRNS